MKVYKVFAAGQTGPVHPAGNNLACSGFIMDSGTSGTFKGANGVTFSLTAVDIQQIDVSITEVTASAGGSIIILG